MWHIPFKWISDLLDKKYWVCKHRWCFREATYDYRCPLHQNDP